MATAWVPPSPAVPTTADHRVSLPRHQLQGGTPLLSWDVAVGDRVEARQVREPCRRPVLSHFHPHHPAVSCGPLADGLRMW